MANLFQDVGISTEIGGGRVGWSTGDPFDSSSGLYELWTANAAVGPRGNTDASRLEVTGSPSDNQLIYDVNAAGQLSLSASTTYIFSIFAKADEFNYAGLYTNNNNGSGSSESIQWDLTTGEMDYQWGGHDGAYGSVYYGDGWWRLWAEFESTAGADLSVGPYIASYSGFVGFYGAAHSNGDGAYFWGAYLDTVNYTDWTTFPNLLSVTTTDANTTNIPADLPTTADGDLLICYFAHKSSYGALSVTDSEGVDWEEINDNDHSNQGHSATYAIRASGDESGGTLTIDTPTVAGRALIFRYQAGTWHDTGDLSDALDDGTPAQGGTAAVTAPTTTASWGAANNTFLTVFSGVDDGPTLSSETLTGNGWSMATESYGFGGPSANNYTETAYAYKYDTAASSGAPGTWTLSLTESWWAVTFAIRGSVAGIDNVSEGHNVAGGVATTHAVGARLNRVVAALITAENTGTLSSVTYDGTAMTLAPDTSIQHSGGTATRSYIYYMLDADLPAAGTYNCVVNGLNACSRIVISLSGVKQEAPADGDAVEASSTDTITSSTLTVGESDSIILSTATCNNGVTAWQEIAGQVLEAVYQAGGNYDSAAYSKRADANTTIQADLGESESRITMSSVVFEPLTADPPVITVGPTVRKRTDTTTLIAATATE